MSTRMIKKLGN